MPPPRATPRSSPDLFRAFLELHDECMDRTIVEAGYHALAGAMHCAEAAEDLEALDAVISLSERRQAELDAQHPPHALARSQASLRGTTPVFGSLVVTGRAVRSRLHAEAAWVKAEGAMGAR